MSTNAFTPNGPTSLVTANTTAAAGVQCVSVQGNPTCFRFYNACASCVTIGYGSSAQAATNAAVFPTGNSSTTTFNNWQLPSGAVEVMRTPMPAPYFSILIAASGANGNVFITPGEGL
jgi:hypothetical protein